MPIASLRTSATHVPVVLYRPVLCCAVPRSQADCLTDPSDVFLYLEDHSIGRDHALFYEAYATYLELKGSFSQAELVYQEGINRWGGGCWCTCFVRMTHTSSLFKPVCCISHNWLHGMVHAHMLPLCQRQLRAVILPQHVGLNDP